MLKKPNETRLQPSGCLIGGEISPLFPHTLTSNPQNHVTHHARTPANPSSFSNIDLLIVWWPTSDTREIKGGEGGGEGVRFSQFSLSELIIIQGVDGVHLESGPFAILNEVV